jgi:HK97 family phage prohead protease
MNPLQLKLLASNAAQGAFAGLASTFGLDRQGDMIEPGAFDATLADWSTRNFAIPLLWQHDQGQPLGAISTASAAADGLRVSGQIVTTTPGGAHAHALAMAGSLSMSIGYTVPAGKARTVNGVRHLSAIDLHEISLVSVPANPDARITEIKSAAQCRSIREFEALARDALGLSSRDAKAVASKAWPVLQRDADGQHRDGGSLEIVTNAVAILRQSNPIT